MDSLRFAIRRHGLGCYKRDAARDTFRDFERGVLRDTIIGVIIEFLSTGAGGFVIGRGCLGVQARVLRFGGLRV